MNIYTHAGQVTARMFDGPPEAYEGVIKILPFILVRYVSRRAEVPDDTYSIWQHTLTFELVVGAESLRSKKESQRTVYSMLREVYDSLHGKWPNSTAQTLTGYSLLDGTQITTTNFNALRPLMEAGGEDERLIVELPRIAVYSTRYQIMLET